MTNPSRDTGLPGESSLQEGPRRYAPKQGDGRRAAVSDFHVSLLLMGRRPLSRPDT